MKTATITIKENLLLNERLENISKKITEAVKGHLQNLHLAFPLLDSSDNNSAQNVQADKVVLNLVFHFQ